MVVCIAAFKMSGPTKWDPYKFYDVSEEELAAIKERKQMRLQRKAEWQRKVTNPFKPASYHIVSDGSYIHKFLEYKHSSC